MKIFLKCNSSGRFAKEGGWTFSENEAMEFASVQEAERFCREHRLKAMAVAKVGASTYPLSLNCEQTAR